MFLYLTYRTVRLQAFEFGCSDEDLVRNPLRSSAFAGGLFAIGALPAVLTFGLLDHDNAVLFGSLACCVVLFCVGAIKTKLTRTNPVLSGLENMLCGATGAACALPAPAPAPAPLQRLRAYPFAVCYAIGLLYEKLAPGVNPNELC